MLQACLLDTGFSANTLVKEPGRGAQVRYIAGDPSPKRRLRMTVLESSVGRLRRIDAAQHAKKNGRNLHSGSALSGQG